MLEVFVLRAPEVKLQRANLRAETIAVASGSVMYSFRFAVLGDIDEFDLFGMPFMACFGRKVCPPTPSGAHRSPVAGTGARPCDQRPCRGTLLTRPSSRRSLGRELSPDASAAHACIDGDACSACNVFRRFVAAQTQETHRAGSRPRL